MSQTEKRYFSIHGLVSFSIEGEKNKIDYLCRQCEYFLVPGPLDNVNIKIYIGPFKSIVDQSQTYRIVNRKYYVGEAVIFAEDIYKTARWRLQIEDLDGVQTKFYFDGNGWTKYILHKSFVEVLLRHKLNQKGFLMIHSSAVSIDGKGIIFPASPEAGKTSTMLNYLAAGNSFMSDDFSLVGRGKIYAYPTPITLHSHNLKRHPFLAEALSSKDKWEIFWRTFIFKLTLGMGDVSYKVDIWNKLKGVSVAAYTPLSRIVLLTKYSGDKVEECTISKKELIEKLLIVNYYETVLFNGYLKAYYYQNLESTEHDFWNKMRSNIDEILTEDYYSEILLPRKYTMSEFKMIARMIENV